jgi:hypothetical protein
MDIQGKVQDIAAKVHAQKASISTEEGTKNAFVMPFISTVLGYDVFSPSEVIPEFIADVGIKKGEKIDYALVCNGEVQILIEVKKVAEPLDVRHASQLFRYFAATKARVAILTNGETYEFYTDLDAPNVTVRQERAKPMKLRRWRLWSLSLKLMFKGISLPQTKNLKDTVSYGPSCVAKSRLVV